MLKLFVILCCFIPLLSATPLKPRAAMDLKALFSGQNQVKRIPDCESGYTESSGCTQWKDAGFCDSASAYYQFMLSNCKAACGICEAPPPPYATAEKITFNTADCLSASNLNRTQRHGVPSLVWDSTLASESADWALHLAQRDFENSATKLVHSDANSAYGENLYYAGTSAIGSLASCTNAVKSWYSEIDDYDFNNPGTSTNGKAIGHFTQVVWKSTNKVGVGIAAVTKNGWTYTFVAARYTPPGNQAGQYAENVPNVVSNK